MRFVSVWHLNLVGVVVGGHGVVLSGTRAAGWACTRIVSTFFGGSASLPMGWSLCVSVFGAGGGGCLV